MFSATQRVQRTNASACSNSLVIMGLLISVDDIINGCLSALSCSCGVLRWFSSFLCVVQSPYCFVKEI